MPHFIKFNHYAIVDRSQLGIVLFCKSFHPNERRVNVDVEKFGNGSERITVWVYPDRQEFFLLAPSFMPCWRKLAAAFFVHVEALALYKSRFYILTRLTLLALIYTANLPIGHF